MSEGECPNQALKTARVEKVQMTRGHFIVYHLEWNGDIAAKGGVSPLRSRLRLTIYYQLDTYGGKYHYFQAVVFTGKNWLFQNDEK